MALDLKGLIKQQDSAPPKATNPFVDPTGKPAIETGMKGSVPSGANVARIGAVVNHNISRQKPGMTYFYSTRPNLGFFLDGKDRVKFKGNYYETSDPAVISFIKSHYGKYVTEITAEQKEDRQTLKDDGGNSAGNTNQL